MISDSSKAQSQSPSSDVVIRKIKIHRAMKEPMIVYGRRAVIFPITTHLCAITASDCATMHMKCRYGAVRSEASAQTAGHHVKRSHFPAALWSPINMRSGYAPARQWSGFVHHVEFTPLSIDPNKPCAMYCTACVQSSTQSCSTANPMAAARRESERAKERGRASRVRTMPRRSNLGGE